MNEQIVTAFKAVADGFSPDRVLADPSLNATFLKECRGLGVTGTDASLNRALLNLRKAGNLRGLKSKRSNFAAEDQYRFAAEMAVRFLERRDSISLDQVLCDPTSAAQFDALAALIAPGFMPVEYRWAALNLRKSRRLQPELLSRVVEAAALNSYRVVGLDIASVANEAGLYLFFSKDAALYVGEAENLQTRIRKHLDHSDNKGLARWLWQEGSDELHLETHVLPPKTPVRVRRALEIELIRSRNPIFNVKR